MGQIAVAVSGGVDSLAALLLLKQAGIRPVGVHCLLHEEATIPPGLPQILSSLDIELLVLDLRANFRHQVIDYFIDAHKSGQTPNPCAICNKTIKFGILLDKVLEAGFDKLATGHYAEICEQNSGQKELKQAHDTEKDQSYFLSLIPKSGLKNILFPLAQISKEDVRVFIRNAGLNPPVPKESQDICFLAKTSRSAFLECYLESRAGAIRLDTGYNTRIIGEHSGLWRYTIGQRKGMGIPFSEPLYAVEKDLTTNELVVAPKPFAFMKCCAIEAVNLLTNPATWPRELYARIRYNQPLLPCQATYEAGRIKLVFKKPVIITAPGQIGCLYSDTGQVLGAGIIRKTTRFLPGEQEMFSSPPSGIMPNFQKGSGHGTAEHDPAHDYL